MKTASYTTQIETLTAQLEIEKALRTQLINAKRSEAITEFNIWFGRYYQGEFDLVRTDIGETFTFTLCCKDSDRKTWDTVKISIRTRSRFRRNEGEALYCKHSISVSGNGSDTITDFSMQIMELSGKFAGEVRVNKDVILDRFVDINNNHHEAIENAETKIVDIKREISELEEAIKQAQIDAIIEEAKGKNGLKTNSLSLYLGASREVRNVGKIQIDRITKSGKTAFVEIWTLIDGELTIWAHEMQIKREYLEEFVCNHIATK